MSAGHSSGRTHALIELRNFGHLSAVYGEAFATAGVRRLQWCMHLWGASVFVIGPQCFLVTLPLIPSETTLIGSLIERWQWALATTPLDFGGNRALPVVLVEAVTIASVGLTDGRLRYPDELEREDTAPSLPPVRYGKRWSMGYERDMEIALTFYNALTQRRLSLVLQPILQRGAPHTVLYHEALARLRVPHGQPELTPSQFVPALERLGLVRVLDHAVLAAVVDRLESQPDLQLGCNLSALSLISDSWWTLFIQRIAAQPDVAARLTLEITETAAVDNLASAAAFVRQLQHLGCRIALDDFGAGHSRLAFARAVHPQIIKIDQSFVCAARNNSAAADQLRHLVSLCQTLAPVVICEGIERPYDADLASSAGADWLQGYAVAQAAAPNPPVDLGLLDLQDMTEWMR